MLDRQVCVRVTYFVTSLTMSDPQSSNMRHMVNDVRAPSGVKSNDLMVILDSVFLFGLHCINLSQLRIL